MSDKFNKVAKKRGESIVKSSFFEIDYECPKNPLKIIDALKKFQAFKNTFNEDASDELKHYINLTLLPFKN